jgi:hypothetical protein
MSALDPNRLFGSITTEKVIATVVGLVVAALVEFLFKPIRSLRRNCELNRELRDLLREDRDFTLCYNPVTKASKTITFLPSGKVGKGRNNNEDTWKITKGRLDIFASDGMLFSRFIYDKAAGLLKHTNDANARAVINQYITPHFMPLE